MHRFLLLLLLPLLLSLLACAEESSSDDPTDSASASSPATPVVLSDAEWVEKGVPDPNRVWTSEDMAKAYTVLSEMRNSSSATLPRHDSTGKEPLFARIVAPENVAFFRNDSLSMDDKIRMGMEITQSYAQIYYLYVNAIMAGESYAPEMLEMMIGMLKIESELGTVINQIIASTPEERRNTEQFKSGLKQAQDGIVQTFKGTITVLRDKELFTQPQLEKLALAFKEVTPGLMDFLSEEAKEELRLEAQTTLAETDNPIITSVLRDTFPGAVKGE